MFRDMEQTLYPLNTSDLLQFQASLLRLVYHGSKDGGTRAENTAEQIEQLLPR